MPAMVPLLPGDILLYEGKGFWAKVIKLKTGSRFSHCELYRGGGVSWASRDGEGVGAYLLRTEDLTAVYRPVGPLDWAAADAWFATVDGQGYDWVGLMATVFAKWQGRDNGKMFCSEFLVRVFRALAAPLFPTDVDADGVAPGDVPKSSRVLRVWRAW